VSDRKLVPSLVQATRAYSLYWGDNVWDGDRKNRKGRATIGSGECGRIDEASDQIVAIVVAYS
jgi:hypothetical protein